MTTASAPPARKHSDTAPSDLPPPRHGLPRYFLVKLVLVGIVDALGVYGVLALAANKSWLGLAAMLVGLIAVNVVYFSKRALPAKYLLPGLVFLLVYQVYVVLYTGYAAFTNYGDGHNSTRSDAVAAILAKSESRVPDSPTYALVVVSKDGQLGFLVKDPITGKSELGTADQPLQERTDAKAGADGKLSVPGWTGLAFADLVKQQAAVTTLRVPVSDDPTKGSLRTQDGSTAFVYSPSLKYDEAAGTLTDTTKGIVYKADQNTGNFVSQDGKTVLEPGWKVFVGFKNFTRVLTEKDIRGPFLSVLIWTFAFALLSVLTSFGLGLFLAMVLNDDRMRGRRTYRSLLILPYAFPSFLSCLVWAGLLNTDFGFINQKLLGGSHIQWLTSPWPARFSVLLVNLWLGFPYMFLVATGALQSIPGELSEAARVDGASGWRVFRSVKFPLLLVSLAPLLIASFAYNFNNFNTIFLVTTGGPKNLNAPVDVGSTDILISFVYKLAFGGANRQYGFACAVSIIIFVIIATISAISFRRTRALEELI
jgi:arabinogalactan oligomer / maltooligosaccharide transport system permease protein